MDSDFRDLIELCRAQFYTSTSQSTCQINPGSAAQAVLFADALWLTWTGRTRSARPILQKLLSQGNWCGWGQAGLLELASHTENHRYLESLLSDYSNSSTPCETRSIDLLQHHGIHLALATSDWMAIEEHFEGLPKGAALKSPDLFLARSEFYYAAGRASDFADLLAAASPEVRSSTQYLSQQAKFTALNEGVGGWSRAFHSLSEKHPEIQSLAVDAALSDLLDDSPEVVSSAVSKLEHIAEQSRSDVKLLMELASMLALHRQPEVSERVYRRIDINGTSLDDFASFHVLVAWNAVYRGKLDIAKESITSALNLAPRHYGANYVKALIAKRENNADAGLEALKILHAADPYNENVRSMIVGFREELPSPEWESLYSDSRHMWKAPKP